MSTRIQAPRRRRVSLAQPRLPMPFPSPSLPGQTQPEVSTPCTVPFDGDEWMFSVEWEGSRALLRAGADGSIRLQGEMAILDGRFPEIVAAGPLKGSRSAVIDGSICVLDAQGRPDLAALFTRVTERTCGMPGAVYLATDVLHVDGESVVKRPLHERLGILRELIPANSRIQLPDHVAGHGRALAQAAASRGLAALLARRAEAPYRAGLASHDRLRIALIERRDAVVVGWFTTNAGVRVVLADWVDGRLDVVGTAAVEGVVTTRWLAAAVEAANETEMVDGAELAGSAVSWVRPRLVATVDTSGAAAGDPTRLPAWRLVALRDDINPQWCLRRTPVKPPQASSRQSLPPFSPTVLSPLPIEGAA